MLYESMQMNFREKQMTYFRELCGIYAIILRDIDDTHEIEDTARSRGNPRDKQNNRQGMRFPAVICNLGWCPKQTFFEIRK